MIQATTPTSITKSIHEFSQKINRLSEPVWVDVKPSNGAVEQQCYYNVRDAVSRDGGSVEFGWIIWELPDVYIEAEHHAVWCSEGVNLLDLTPKSDNEEVILFLPDPKSRFFFNNPKWYDNHRLPISGAPEVATFLKSSERLSKFMIRHSQPFGRQRKLDIAGSLADKYDSLQYDRAEAHRRMVDYLDRTQS